MLIPRFFFIANIFFLVLPNVAMAEDTEETQVVPELTFRQASLDRRDASVYHREVHKDYTNQLYLSLKLVRTYNYAHEIVVEPAIRTVKYNPNELETTVDQAYVGSKLSVFDLTAGKKTEYEGSGYFVNPMDLLNEDKDLFDPLYQREGKVFTRLRLRGDNSSVALGYIPSSGEDAKFGKTWAQASLDAFDAEFKIQYTYHAKELSTLGFSLARFFGDVVELHTDNRYMQKQRANNREARFSANYELSDGSIYSLAGTRLVLTSRRTLILEAINNQSGLYGAEFENYFVAEQKAVEETGQQPVSRLIGRKYVFAAFVDEETLPKTSFNISSILNTDDDSSFTAAELRYTLSPITSVSVSPVIYSGKRNSEFGEFPFKQITYLSFKGRF